MKTRMIILFIFSYILLVQATIISVPETKPTLLEAIKDAAKGDTILLAPGTHTQPKLLNVNKAVMIASHFILSNNQKDIESTVINAGTNDMGEWFELSAENSSVVGIRFVGNEEHTLHITAPYASVTHCQFIGGKDQLSVTGGGGYIAHCYFENAGDDAIDCDKSKSWTIEYNLIVNAHQDGIEVRLHDKDAPLTTHIFRYNEVIGSGESGIQLIDYEDDSYREFLIHNNLFRSCRGAGVSCMYQEKDNTSEVYRGSLMQEKAFVFNNTFAKCNYGLTISPGLIILNNIFVDLSTKGIERGIYVDDSNDNSIVDYCLFYNNTTPYDPDIKIGKNIIEDQDPLLNDNYELGDGSPCIKAGIDQYSWGGTTFKLPTSDYIGDKPDLGAKQIEGTKWSARQLPVIDAGKDLVILEPSNHVNLNASLADISILNVNSITLQWSKISGPGEVTFVDAASAVTTAAFSQQGTYELMLKGYNSENQLSDKLNVWYVKDFREQSASVGNSTDLFLEAEDYRHLVGSAEVLPHKGASGEVIRSQDDQNLRAYTEYQISTQSSATYYIWVRVSGSNIDKNVVYVSLNNLKNEKKVSGTSDNKFSDASWQKVSFEHIPEGSYPLRIRAAKAGVMWDKIFISTNAKKHPLD
jgi:hypothetical protein